MWGISNEEQKQQLGNSVTAEVNANAKKKKELEECRCASVDVNAANSGLVSDKCEKQQQKFKDNSKEDKFKFGIGKEEEEEGIDSGFISGPNTCSSLTFDETSEDIGHAQKPNITVPAPKQQQQKKYKEQQESKTFLDSGCIESEEEEEFEVEDDADIGNSAKNIDASVANGAKTDGVVKRQSEAQVQNELHNIKVGAAVRPRIYTTSDNIKIADEMRFKNNVDSGISERFCSLSLQTGGAGINNLNSTQRRSNMNTSMINDGAQQQQNTRQQSSPALQQQQQSRQKPRGWEEFYQQNSDGDT